MSLATRLLVLLSPWLDLTISNPDVPAVEVRDPWLASTGLRVAGLTWAGGDDPTQPRLSPLNGELAGLAPPLGTSSAASPADLRPDGPVDVTSGVQGSAGNLRHF